MTSASYRFAFAFFSSLALKSKDVLCYSPQPPLDGCDSGDDKRGGKMPAEMPFKKFPCFKKLHFFSTEFTF